MHVDVSSVPIQHLFSSIISMLDDLNPSLYNSPCIPLEHIYTVTSVRRFGGRILNKSRAICVMQLSAALIDVLRAVTF